jgi:hypothetical protein
MSNEMKVIREQAAMMSDSHNWVLFYMVGIPNCQFRDLFLTEWRYSRKDKNNRPEKPETTK